MNQFLYSAYSCEMPESLFAAFTSIDTFSQHLYSEVAAKFLAVLEAVSDCLCRTVNSNRNAIDSYILDSLRQCLAGSDAQSPRRNPYVRKALARSSKRVHAGGPCLVLPDVFQTGTDLSRALQSFSRQSKPNSSSTLGPSSR